MPFKTVQKLSPATVTVVTTAETAVLTTTAVVYDQPMPFVGGSTGGGQGVTISGIINVVPVGASSTFATIRVRQGTIAGPIVGVGQTVTVVAGSDATIPYEEIDTSRAPAQAGGVIYVVTIQFTAASTNSTVVEATADVAPA